MARYRKRPEVVEAIQYLGPENCAEVCTFIGAEHDPDQCEAREILVQAITCEQICRPGEWVVKDADGNFEVFSAEHFEANYEQVGGAE